MTDLIKQRDEMVKALNGFVWLGNNIDKIETRPAAFREFFEACLVDAKSALALSDWDGSGKASPQAVRDSQSAG